MWGGADSGAVWGGADSGAVWGGADSGAMWGGADSGAMCGGGADIIIESCSFNKSGCCWVSLCYVCHCYLQCVNLD